MRRSSLVAGPAAAVLLASPAAAADHVVKMLNKGKGGMMVFPPANAIYRRETYDNYPAARAILQTVFEGLQLPMGLALRVESRWFAKILRPKEAAAMIRSLFVSMQELNKGARRPQNVPPTRVKKLGVIGAGFMGASIGFVSAQAGIEVVLIDRDQASADKGKAHAKSVIDGNIARGRATEAEECGAKCADGENDGPSEHIYAPLETRAVTGSSTKCESCGTPPIHPVRIWD